LYHYCDVAQSIVPFHYTAHQEALAVEYGLSHVEYVMKIVTEVAKRRCLSTLNKRQAEKESSEIKSK
jgi:hypothetical protein